jgi:predicted small integral membrane protein
MDWLIDQVTTPFVAIYQWAVRLYEGYPQNIAWMAWTWQTGVFFLLIALGLAILTLLAARRIEPDRHGVLGLATTRGDRYFLALLGSAFIHLIFLGVFGAETITSLAIGGETWEVSRLWIGSAISVLYAVIVFWLV